MGYHRLLLLALLTLVTCVVQAQTRYVSDELVITVRTGPSTQNAIIRNLSSGDRVQVLEENEEGNYALVRTDDGTEGWALTQYLQDGVSGDELAAAAQRELTTTRARLQELEIQVADLSAALEQTRAALTNSESSGQNLSAELADIRSASASAIELRDQNESLLRRNNELSAEVDLREMENAELGSRSRQNWFVVGAAVLLGGIVIGLVAPSLRPRRKSTW